MVRSARHTLTSIPVVSLLTSVAACSPTEAIPEAPSPSPQAIVHGTIALDHAGAGHRVALLWLYWPEEDCVRSGTPGTTTESVSCSGAHVVTLGSVEATTGGFRLVQAEPPPSFVHGYDTDVAEAIVVEIAPDQDPATVTLDTITGIAPEHLVVWVPTPLGADRIEAQELGGAPLARGFYLVRAEVGPQVEGFDDDGDRVFTHRSGLVVDGDPSLTLEPVHLDEEGYRVPFAPQLFL